MGKRKKAARKPQGPKKREPLQTTFNCLFCNHEDAVTCKLDKKAGIGQLSCKVCGQQYQSNINYLSHAVDVYSDWVDACDDIANAKPAKSGPTSQRKRESQSQPYSQGGGREDSPGGGGDLSDLEDEHFDDDNGAVRGGRSGGASSRRITASMDDDEDDDIF